MTKVSINKSTDWLKMKQENGNAPDNVATLEAQTAHNNLC